MTDFIVITFAFLTMVIGFLLFLPFLCLALLFLLLAGLIVGACYACMWLAKKIDS